MAQNTGKTAGSEISAKLSAVVQSGQMAVGGTLAGAQAAVGSVSSDGAIPLLEDMRNIAAENSNIFKKIFNKYIMIVLVYALIMAIFSNFGRLDNELLKMLIIIPITGQMLHFYLDSQLWKFSEKHNRENILKHILGN